MNLNILGHRYKVTYEDSLARDLDSLGRSCGNAQWIQIDSTTSDSTQSTTLLHEIIEQLNFLLEIGLEHRQISQIETGLWQVIHENKLTF